MTIAKIRRLLEGRRVPRSAADACAADPRGGVRDLHEAYCKRQQEHQRERRRLRRLYSMEVALARDAAHVVAGVDEVGRGPLAGPVVAACVILPEKPKLLGLDDSKRVPAEARARIEREIRACALGVGTGVVESEEVDERNIYHASLRAMELAVEACAPARPTYLLLDAVKLKSSPLPQQGLIGGDGRCACIAAASIVAKVLRDRLMEELELRFPGYDFAVHKGYGTAHHLARLRELGPSPAHRRSFGPVADLEATAELSRFRQALGEAIDDHQLDRAWQDVGALLAAMQADERARIEEEWQERKAALRARAGAEDEAAGDDGDGDEEDVDAAD